MTFDQYLAELHTLSKTCDFGDLRDSLVRDRIVCGIPDNGLRERLLHEPALTLEKAVNMYRTAEITRAQAKELHRDGAAVHAVKREEQHTKQPTKQRQQRMKTPKSKCSRCGGTHIPQSCPAYGKICNSCGKNNHFAKCERKKYIQLKSSQMKFFVDSVQTNMTDKAEWIVPLIVNETIIPFKLDTGAQINLLSMDDYRTLKVKNKIHSTKIKVTVYTGEDVPVKGSCLVTLKHKGQLLKTHMLIVEKSVQPILGLSTCEKLDLVRRVFVVTSQFKANETSFMDEYKDVFEGLAGAKWFSKLDVSSGFWQLKLDKASSKLCTFNTPESRYRFLRLPYGILSAPEVYNKTIHMIFEHLPGVETMMDDIIVWGSNRQEHDGRLRQVLELIRQSNLKLNKEKCEFAVKSLTFVGDVLSEEGVRPDPRKTSAIVNMERPQNKEEVRRFLGMVTYLAKFIPQLSTHSAPLRCLLEQKNEWM